MISELFSVISQWHEFLADGKTTKTFTPSGAFAAFVKNDALTILSIGSILQFQNSRSFLYIHRDIDASTYRVKKNACLSRDYDWR